MSEHAILVIDDDPAIIELIASKAPEAGCTVEGVGDGALGLQKALTGAYDLIIVDGQLPSLDGFEVCRRLRESNPAIAILILTSRAELVDKLIGLETGADDYLQKPFEIRELLARIRILLKRIRLGQRSDAEKLNASVFVAGPLELNLSKYEATMYGEPVELTTTEFSLLLYLYEHRGRAVTREQITEDLWGTAGSHVERNLTTHMSRLRTKLAVRPGTPELIATVKGVGYRFLEEVELGGVGPSEK